MAHAINAAEDFDIGPLSWVKDEIDQALDSVLENLAAVAAAPGDITPLRFSQTHLYQVNGALDMVGLAGCKHFCAGIEQCVERLENKSIAAEPETLQVLSRAVDVLRVYLRDLLDGAPDLPLRFFPALQALAEIQGETLEESALFFPDVELRAPKDLPSRPLDANDYPAYIAEQRVLFQKSLLRWLKDESAEGLSDMRRAIDNVQQVQAAAQRTLWWVAAAFTDAMLQDAIAERPGVKRLCRRLDQQLRSSGEGTSRASGTLLRDLLYYVALCAPLGERILRVKAVFGLDALLPDAGTPVLSPAELAAAQQQALDTLKAALEPLKSTWAAAEQQPDALDHFLHQLSDVVEPSHHLGDTAVAGLFASLHELATALDLDAAKMSEAALLEVAASLNLLEESLENYDRLGAKHMQALELQARRLQELMDGGPMADLSGAPLPMQLQGEAMTAVAQQLRAALKLAEQSLDAYFRNTGDRQSLQAAMTPLQQAAAAFDMLDLPVPTAVAKACASLAAHFYDNATTADQALFELVAESLSLLDFHAEALPRIRPESQTALEAILTRLESQLTLLSQVEVAEPAVVESVAPSVPETPEVMTDRALDAELLDIYLAETEEVLAHVAQHLQALRVNATDNGALVEVRRGFHTLKGSGRTVGLAALGEVAWSVEKLLNAVLENGVVPSAAQLGFVERASAAFADWAAALREAHVVELTPADWQREADVLESENASQQRVADAAEVLIDGTRKLSRALYDIFLAEAGQHVQALRQGQAELAAQPALAPSDPMRRAAHTLASNAGAAGFKAIEDLARGLEHWLDAQAGAWSEPALALIGKAVDALADMLDKAAGQREPRPALALLTALQSAAQASVASRPSAMEIEAAAKDSAVVESMAVAAPAPPVAVDQELLTVFIEEARELVPHIGSELRAWHVQPDAVEHADTLQRALHTLKGSARMAGQSALGDAVHGMEDRIMRALKSEIDAAAFDNLFTSFDQIGSLLEAALTEDDTHAPTATTTIMSGRATERRTQFLRVRADVLDRLINEAGEISIARARMAREMLAFKQSSQELTESVQRLRNYLREMEIEAESQLQSRMTQLQETHETFDPLEFDRFTRLQELTRMMAESVNDVATIQHGLLMNVDETEAALQQQNRMNRELQHGLMDVRMVPFALISERLQRIVRQTARELGKRVDMHIDGETVELDRSVLDKIGAPLEHLLRNAVSHGMETSAARKKAGKPAAGNVTLKVRQESDEIVLTVSDDGAGINLERVRTKAVAQGLLAPDQEYGEQALLSAIFEPGFSTASKVSQISGRGVGLDAVRSDITALGGRIDVSNTPGRGATFNVHLPVTLSVSQVVLVRAGQRQFALPAVMVEQVQKLRPELLAQAGETGSVGWSGRQYPLHFLGRLVGDAEHAPEEQRYTPVLLLHSGTFHVALHVDEIIGNQEVVLKPIGMQLSRVPGIAGATIMGDGNIVLILNPVQLANREMLAAGKVSISAAAPLEVAEAPLAMVVDDSLTMRKVLGRLLEREGYRVVTAKDGMDALQQLQETVPAIMLTDIEMPRMDGFELARNVRGDARTAHVPIVVISSRTAEKHRNLAREIGVDAYFGKPVQDEELLAQIAALLAQPTVPHPV